MGLLDKLLPEKKICSICGNEIKLLGNKKLADGNCCKNCASKLSPWFTERRQSTVEEIKAQIDYREQNKEEVSVFHTTRTLGKNSGTRIYLDEDHCKFIVSSSSNFKNGNPDVLSYDQVTGCSIDMRESKSELSYRDEENHIKSYDPKQYDYRYSCYLTLFVNHPYFSEMTFQVGSSVEIKNEFVGENLQKIERPPLPAVTPNEYTAAKHTLASKGVSPRQKAEARKVIRMFEERHAEIERRKNEKVAKIPSFIPNLEEYPEYQDLYMVTDEIRFTLMQARLEGREKMEHKEIVVCPTCGRKTIPDENGCCEYCLSFIDE